MRAAISVLASSMRPATTAWLQFQHGGCVQLNPLFLGVVTHDDDILAKCPKSALSDTEHCSFALASWLWHHGFVQKPHLIIESKPDDDLLKGVCSLCPVRFNLKGNTLSLKALLRGMFDAHVKLVHTPKSKVSAEG